MINQLISMAAWKGMSDKRFPLWTLINAYNQQPERFAEMQRSGFFPTEQGPMPLQPAAQPAQQVQPVQQPQDHSAQLANEVRGIKDDVKQLLRYNTQQHRRIQDLENYVKQVPVTPNPVVPTPTP